MKAIVYVFPKLTRPVFMHMRQEILSAGYDELMKFYYTHNGKRRTTLRAS